MAFDNGSREGDRQFGEQPAQNPWQPAPDQSASHGSSGQSPFGQAPFGGQSSSQGGPSAPFSQEQSPFMGGQPSSGGQGGQLSGQTGQPSPYGQNPSPFGGQQPRSPQPAERPGFGFGPPGQGPQDPPPGQTPPPGHAAPPGPPAPAPPPGRSRRTGLIAGIVGAVLVIAAAGAAVTWNRGSEEAGPTVQQPPVTAEPTDGPTPPVGPEPPNLTPQPMPGPGQEGNPDLRRDPLEPIPTAEVGSEYDVLTKNRLYELPIPDHECAEELVPFGADRDSELDRLMPFYECAVALHEPAVEQLDDSGVEPYFDLYTDPDSTDCGATQPEWTGVYCSADRGVRLDLGWASSLDPNYRPAFGYGYMILFHEYGHHVQDRAGIFNTFNAGTWESSEAALRRGELQAECLAAAGMARSGYVDDEWRAAYGTIADNPENDSASHGSAESKQYWTHRGWNAQTYGDCNTWAAVPDLVN